MARFVYALNMSLDGFVDHDRFAPDPVLFRHFIEDVASLAGCIYGRRMYEVMRYWDGEQSEWNDAEREYARVWRAMRKWVVSTTLDDVGPNASLIVGNLEEEARRIKDTIEGRVEVAGPQLAAALADLGLVDEFRVYLHPAVLGHGKPFFATRPPKLKLVGNERIGEESVLLTYVPA